MSRRVHHCMESVPVIIGIVVMLIVTPSAQATWSIVIADSETKEVAVGTVTCLTGFDLLAIVPVVVVGKGAAAVQAAGDFNGIRRPIIFDHFFLETPPEEILELLAEISGHQSRQYGIADTLGRMITFTGNSTFQWAGGVIGTQGSMVYAIQGNILAGGCVVPEIEAAVLNTPGDVPAKLMAGMEAARVNGGDGRCSCSQNDPTGCGCPPPDFTKSGHIGGVIVARIGDTDDKICDADGCADGDYFMRLNVPFQSPGAPDPVFQLQELFDAWRVDHVGRPDAIQSIVTFDPERILPNGVDTTTMHITLLDFSGQPITAAIESVTVEHAANSAGISSIGPVIDQGGGSYSVEITAGTGSGIDRFAVTIEDDFRPVVLMPAPPLEYFPLGDSDFDRDLDVFDFADLNDCLTGPIAESGVDCRVFDFDVDTDIDWHDVGAFLLAHTGDCNVLITQQPQDTTACLNGPAVFEVEASGVNVSYQWRLEGVDIPGATQSVLVIDPVTHDELGFYTVEAHTICGSALSEEAELTIFDPPVILTHPDPVITCSGESVQFTVDAGGVEPFTYQWLLDGAEIPGATEQTLIIKSAQPDDLGSYRCVVTDDCDLRITSDPADLTFHPDAEIIDQPVGGEVCIGDDIILFVVAGGAVSFQWFKDDVPLDGQTDFFLIINAATPEDSGVYYVEAFGECNSAVSDDAVIEVIDCASP